MVLCRVHSSTTANGRKEAVFLETDPSQNVTRSSLADAAPLQSAGELCNPVDRQTDKDTNRCEWKLSLSHFMGEILSFIYLFIYCFIVWLLMIISP